MLSSLKLSLNLLFSYNLGAEACDEELLVKMKYPTLVCIIDVMYS